MIKLNRMLLGIAIISLAGCGGGGGGGGDTPSNPSPVTMVLKVSTTGTLPAGTSLYGVGFTVTLPAGVTIATDQSGNVTTGAVTPSGVISASTSTSAAVYTPAGNTLQVTVASTAARSATGGFGTGEFVSITLTRSAGSSTKTATDFPLTGFARANYLYQQVDGISISVSVQ